MRSENSKVARSRRLAIAILGRKRRKRLMLQGGRATGEGMSVARL
jgi:hypothetical protein